MASAEVGTFALAWESVQLLNKCMDGTAAILQTLSSVPAGGAFGKTTKWAMEVHGGLGVLAEFGADRWLREAMILAIWEGTSHRQILDGLEVMERKQAHKTLFEQLKDLTPAKELQELEVEVERHLKLPTEEKEVQAEAIFRRLAVFTAGKLSQRHPS